MQERRRHHRNAAMLKIKFRIVREGPKPEMSELVEGDIRNLSIEGLAMETSIVEVDGLHVSYNELPGPKNRIYLQWDLPGEKSIKAVGETIWYERVSGSKPLFAVGIRFVEISKESSQLLKDYLDVSAGTGPMSI